MDHIDKNFYIILLFKVILRAFETSDILCARQFSYVNETFEKAVQLPLQGVIILKSSLGKIKDNMENVATGRAAKFFGPDARKVWRDIVRHQEVFADNLQARGQPVQVLDPTLYSSMQRRDLLAQTLEQLIQVHYTIVAVQLLIHILS